MTQRAPVNPSHYRLSSETWAEIVEAYRNGATARELAVKWKVAPGSVYYHACKDGWSKKQNGDERARAHARAVEATEAARTSSIREEETRASELFDGIEGVEEDDGDAASLARLAILASGRAMKGRLWVEAKALAGLAESYARLGDRVPGHWANGGASPQEEAAMAVVLERLERLDELEAAEEARRADAPEHEQTFTFTRGGLRRSDAGA